VVGGGGAGGRAAQLVNRHVGELEKLQVFTHGSVLLIP